MTSGGGTLRGEGARLVERVDDRALHDRLIDANQQVLERLAVLGQPDRLRVRAEQPDAELLEDALPVQIHRQIEAVCPPRVGRQASGRSRRMIRRTTSTVSGSM